MAEILQQLHPIQSQPQQCSPTVNGLDLIMDMAVEDEDKTDSDVVTLHINQNSVIFEPNSKPLAIILWVLCAYTYHNMLRAPDEKGTPWSPELACEKTVCCLPSTVCSHMDFSLTYLHQQGLIEPVIKLN